MHRCRSKQTCSTAISEKETEPTRWKLPVVDRSSQSARLNSFSVIAWVCVFFFRLSSLKPEPSLSYQLAFSLRKNSTLWWRSFLLWWRQRWWWLHAHISMANCSSAAMASPEALPSRLARIVLVRMPPIFRQRLCPLRFRFGLAARRLEERIECGIPFSFSFFLPRISVLLFNMDRRFSSFLLVLYPKAKGKEGMEWSVPVVEN